ncbi:MAG: FtsW/RodA/SpoVE family cell cycle protein [Clostridia bacterium]|nr:FtsW/RodA/SpoVE family cell cycle protein [Clostridia bacterium]
MSLSHRKNEGTLLLYVFLFVTTGLVLLALTKGRGVDWQPIIYGAVVTAVFLICHVFLIINKHQGDPYLLPLAAMLSATGLILISRLQPQLAAKQLVWLTIGLICLLLVVLLTREYNRLEEYQYVYIIFGLLALVGTVLFGTEVGGATAWISIGPLRVQPVELVKIFLVIFLASYLEERKELLAQGTFKVMGVNLPHPKHSGPLIIMWGLSVVFLVMQKDLGAALLFFGTFLTMVYIATSRWAYVLTGMLLFLGAAGIAYYLFDHVQTRVSIWLDPWADVEGKGYQVVQSLFAIASGGLVGTGLGLGYPKFIPEVHTDFIFAALTEEMGLLGGIGIILLYIIFLYRGFRIALLAGNGFGMLLAGGLTALLGIQAFTILGGVTKLVPLTGITLPFVSYGGSSLVANFILLGLLLNVSHGAVKHGK